MSERAMWLQVSPNSFALHLDGEQLAKLWYMAGVHQWCYILGDGKKLTGTEFVPNDIQDPVMAQHWVQGALYPEVMKELARMEHRARAVLLAQPLKTEELKWTKRHG